MSSGGGELLVTHQNHEVMSSGISGVVLVCMYARRGALSLNKENDTVI